MEKMKLAIFSLAVLAGLSQSRTAAGQVFRINVSDAHFTMPMIECWIAEYQQLDPGFRAEVVSGKDAQSDAVVSTSASSGTQVARYLILPIANAQSAAAHDKKVRHGLNSNLAKSLYVKKNLDELLDVDEAPRQQLEGMVYTLTGSSAATTKLFAQFLDIAPAQLKGKKVLGREENAITAVLTHDDAVSYNVANLIYDLQNRQPISGMHVFAVDLNNNGKISDDEEQAFTNIDQLTDFVANSVSTNIPIGDVNIVLPAQADDHLKSFVAWIGNEGQRFARQYGYLKAQPRLTAQK